MPVSNGRVFLEETCLVAKPPLPFSVLKRRLERRLGAMGLKVLSPFSWQDHRIVSLWSQPVCAGIALRNALIRQVCFATMLPDGD